MTTAVLNKTPTSATTPQISKIVSGVSAMDDQNRLRTLKLRLSFIDAFASGVTALAGPASARLSVGQLNFFLIAANADIAGSPMTFSQIREMVEEISPAIHTTYKIFLDGERGREGLGWLETEADPTDKRRKYLRLTSAGVGVMYDVLSALEA